MSKKFTLEDLAAMVVEGFNSLENRFEGLEQELRSFKKETSENFERIDLRLQQVAWQSDYRELESRVTKLEHRVAVRR